MRRRCCCNNRCSAQFSYAHNSSTCITSFTNESTTSGGCTITATDWTFSDGDTSTAENPTHEYNLSSPIPRTATLEITTSCGQTCSITKEILTPCNDSPLPCYSPSSAESLPLHFLVSLGNMPDKCMGSYFPLRTFGTDVQDPDNRVLCTNPADNGLYAYSSYSWLQLNGDWEIPFYSGPDITGTHRYATESPNVLIFPTWGAIYNAIPFPPKYIIRRNVAVTPVWIQVFTDFNCNSVGTTAEIQVSIWFVFSNLGRSGYHIGTWFKTVTLPPGKKLKEVGPIELDPFPFGFGLNSTAGMPAAWRYPFSDPCGIPPIGTPAIDFPTCVVTPNG